MGTRRELDADENLRSVVDDHETVFVQFHADWCAPCAVLSEFFAEVLDDLDGLVLEVDIEDHADPAADHDVTTNPTLLVFEDGEVVERRAGLPDRPAFRELVAPWT
jgi:thioredoxin 1